mgnify:FL=1
MDELHKRLIETVVKFEIEQLPRTRSGNGYLLLTDGGDEQKRTELAYRVMHTLEKTHCCPCYDTRVGENISSR